MAFKRRNPAHEFARGIIEAFSAPRFRKALHGAAYAEHKAAAKPIREYLKKFVKANWIGSAPPVEIYDCEGDYRRHGKQERSYSILGTSTWPDAAVIRPFRCAFEFDREKHPGSSHFKNALMKASAHVLSGAYEACVFVYILVPTGTQHGYSDLRCKNTQRLIRTLRAKGLYVAIL